jgi:hypothetical protein
MSLAILTKFSAALGRALLGASRDLAPIITVISLFQVLVLHQPFPELLSILAGLGLVIVGLALFVIGLDIGLFPLGETMAEEFARKGSLFWLLLFAFALGAGTAAVGAAAGATLGGARAYGSDDARREIISDLREKSLENKPIEPKDLAFGFLFFPGEAGSAKNLRLQIRETDTGKVHVLNMNF